MAMEPLGHYRLFVRYGFLRHIGLCHGDGTGAPTAKAGGSGTIAGLPTQPH